MLARRRCQPPFGALQDAVDQVFDARIGDVSGRGKLGADMREIWLMQPRFERRTGSSPFSLVEQPRFRAGFDFLRLRAAVGELPEELAHWWETFSTADDAHRRDMLEAVRLEQSRAKAGGGARKVKVHRTGGSGATGVAGSGTAPGGSEAIGAPLQNQDDPRFRPVDGNGTEQADRFDNEGSGAAGEGGSPADPARKRRRRRRKPSGGGSGGEGAPSAPSGGSGGE